MMQTDLGAEYASLNDTDFIAKYRASCFCGAVQLEFSHDPVDAKLCHCLACQKLHGAPMQWAVIFHKQHQRLRRGQDRLRFYHSETGVYQRILPCKVSCGLCGSLIADEGRNMWLAFGSLFDFSASTALPRSFKPSCHIFYGARVIDMFDSLPKWAGHKDLSPRLDI